MDRAPQKHQQVLHRLQILRGEVLQQRYSALELNAELDSLWLSITENGYINPVEVEQIRCLLSNFRDAVISEITH